MWTLGVKGERGWALAGGFVGGGGSMTSERIGGSPFTSGQTKPELMHPELEFTF